MKVLVVEDQTAQRVLTSKVVQGISGMEVISVADAFDGYAELTINPDVALIILDHAMPYVSGLEFMNKLRSKDSYKKIKIVFATADQDYQSFVTAGADACLRKPFSVEALKSTLEEVLTCSLS